MRSLQSAPVENSRVKKKDAWERCGADQHPWCRSQSYNNQHCVGWRWEKFYISKLQNSKGRVKNNDPATSQSDMVVKKVVPVVFIQMFRNGLIVTAKDCKYQSVPL